MKVDLYRKTNLNIQLGHLAILWEVLSSKLSGIVDDKETFNESEIRAVWALEDLIESELVKNGLSGPQIGEWEKILENAQEAMKKVPADYLE